MCLGRSDSSDTLPTNEKHVTFAPQDSVIELPSAVDMEESASSEDELGEGIKTDELMEHFHKLVEDSEGRITYLKMKKELVHKFGTSRFDAHRDMIQNTLSELTSPRRASAMQKSPQQEQLEAIHRSIVPSEQDELAELSEEDLVSHPFKGDLIIAKAAVAKAKYENESYKVYIRNRDRQLYKYIKQEEW